MEHGSPKTLDLSEGGKKIKPRIVDITTYNKITERVNLFNYLGNISYEGEFDIDSKLSNFLKITGILNNMFRPQKTLKILAPELFF